MTIRRQQQQQQNGGVLAWSRCGDGSLAQRRQYPTYPLRAASRRSCQQTGQQWGKPVSRDKIVI